MPFFKILIHDPISTNKLPYKAEDYFSLCSTWKYEGKKNKLQDLHQGPPYLDGSCLGCSIFSEDL